ncbi:MAG: hypothetical protein ACRDQY_20900 [Pseudonocardiaceae bacterium]
MNCTIPPAVAGVTVAVSVTGAPCAAGEAVEVLSVMLAVAVAWGVRPVARLAGLHW